jgi:group II intron reverse transcriptase/maturase
MTQRLIYRILHPDNMRLAWEEVADNRGMPGVDNVSIRRFRHNWEERLATLEYEVRTNRYKPSHLRVRRIPKQAGGFRRIAIPTVADRVMQRAVLEILDPLFDREFLTCSYGYRRGRSLHNALPAIIALRDRGYGWVLDADIDAYFDNINHELLFELVAQKVDDPVVMQLIKGWVDIGRPHKSRPAGIPMGACISPLLANIYLHQMDRQLVMGRWNLIRYADDFIVLAQSEAQAHRAKIVVEEILDNLHLTFEPAKTRIASFKEGFDFLGIRFYRDEYSFTWRDKEVIVDGDVNWLFSHYAPSGYS